MYQRQKEFLVRAACGAVWAVLGWLLVRYALLWLLPFLIALALAALAEPAIDFCRRRMRFKRSFTAAVLTVGLVLILTAVGSRPINIKPSPQSIAPTFFTLSLLKNVIITPIKARSLAYSVIPSDLSETKTPVIVVPMFAPIITGVA